MLTTASPTWASLHLVTELGGGTKAQSFWPKALTGNALSKSPRQVGQCKIIANSTHSPKDLTLKSKLNVVKDFKVIMKLIYGAHSPLFYRSPGMHTLGAEIKLPIKTFYVLLLFVLTCTSSLWIVE